MAIDFPDSPADLDEFTSGDRTWRFDASAPAWRLVASFGGASGPQGPQGAQGPQGPAGTPGPAAIHVEARWTDGEIDLFAFGTDNTDVMDSQWDHAGMLHPATLGRAVEYIIPDFDSADAGYIGAGNYYVFYSLGTPGYSFPWPNTGVADVVAYIRVDVAALPDRITRVWVGGRAYCNPAASLFSNVTDAALTIRSYPDETVLDTVDMVTAGGANEYAIFGYLERVASVWTWHDSVSHPADEAAVMTLFGMTDYFLLP